MSLDNARKTMAAWAQLTQDFVMLSQQLEDLKFVEDENAGEFKIFCCTQDAVEFFKFPNKLAWKGVKVVMISDFPTKLCAVVRSSEFINE